MAHECPNCGMTCFCGAYADITEDTHNCKHCLETDHDNDFEYDDWLDCETTQGGE